jgi:hypothetical protein
MAPGTMSSMRRTPGIQAVIMLAAALCAISSLDCLSKPTEFRCGTGVVCGENSDGAGICETSGYCSFPDDSCQGSGRRYADFAGALSRSCVGSQEDAGSADRDAQDSATCSEGGTPCGTTPPCVDLTTDGDNCGSCGRSCKGATCDTGLCTPTTLASGQNHPWGIMVAGNDLYWTGLDGVMKLTPSSTLPVAFAPGEYRCHFITQDSTFVYWANAGTDGATDGSTRQARKSAAAPVSPKSLGVDQASPSGITVDATDVYWSNSGTNDDDGAVMRASLSGGGLETVAAPERRPHGITIRGGYLYWVAGGTTGASDGQVRRVPLGGGYPEVLAENQANPYFIAVDTENAYWANWPDVGGAVMKVALAGGAPVALAPAQSRPLGLAVDDTYVYWTTFGTASDDHPADGAVLRVARGGGTPLVLAAGQRRPVGIAVDANWVYWVTWGTNAANDGTVMKVAK